MLVVGGREAEDGTVSVRTHGDGQQDTISVGDFLNHVGDEIEPTLE